MPPTSPSPVPGPSAPEALRPRQEIRVLLVEDDPLHSKRIREMLEGSDEAAFVIEQALEVEGALGMLQDGRYHVMLLDLSLPEGDGLDVLARAQVAATAVPIVAMGESDDDSLAIQAVRLGAQDCLPKERVEPRRLVRALRHAVERHRLLSELQLARHREHYVATHDALTGLPNRFHLQDHLRRMLAFAERNGRPLAVLFLDLDRFKTINDSLGHPVGDELLRALVERLCPVIRRSDVMARLGGDEFVIAVQHADSEQAPTRVAEAILERVTKPFRLPSGEHWIGVSIGIAVYPRDGVDVDALIRNADTAMYQVKAAGGNGYRFYDDAMNASVARRLTLERGLRRALATDELKLHYQPRLDLRTGRVVSAEALLRWTSPELGVIAPTEIIPIAEETGLIQNVGRWALATACAEARSWDEQGGEKLGVSVNVSAHELRNEEILRAVKSALWESGLEAGRLELEITETALMRDERTAVAVLTELKRMGVRVSLDDFGTGFSSLSLLKSTPVDVLKIDRSFVRDLQNDGDDDAIVGAILAIAGQLKLEVVAEGVETQRQRDLLRNRGCHEMQGFYFAKALPPAEFVALLARLRSGK